MTTDKPSHNEDECFAKRDAELLKKKRAEQEEQAVQAERKSHHMKCPKCGADLETIEQHSVSIDRCPECQGIWLDHGELELISKHSDPGLLGRVFGDLFGSSRK
jgi:ribosomal protein L37AE/L43A